MIASALLLVSLTSCNDFLDKSPLDEITPDVYFESEADLAAYTINSYSFRTIDGAYGIGMYGDDNGTDNQATPSGNSFWMPGLKLVPAGNGDWDFEPIRKANYFFDNVLPKYEAGIIVGNGDNIKHYIGEMYVIRAYNYFDKLSKIGDFPIVKSALPDDKATLVEASKRQPRHKVARFILEDLDKAIELLKESGPGGKNRVTRDVAYLLRARVALFEGTWLKYHKGTAFVPGGSGWPGNSADIAGFDIDAEINYFLDEAMKSSQVVGDKIVGNLSENTDTREGMSPNLTNLNPYYMQYCDVDMNKYEEILMWRQFKVGLVESNVQMELTRNAGSSGWTRGMVNSFLMRNGLPVYAPNSGYKVEWEKEGVNATLQDRDSRIQIFTKKDGDVNYYQTDGNPIYMVRPYIFNSSETKSVTGFTLKKGKHYAESMAIFHSAGESGAFVFRATEALLIYMEASYERLQSVDPIARNYWKALRRRAKVSDDFNATIEATVMSEEAKGDFSAYSHGALIDRTLFNIRRERRNELCAEGFRWNDLKRWRSCDQVNNYIVEGMRYWGSIYDGAYKDEKGNNLCVVDLGGKGNMSPEVNSVYIRPYQITQTNNSYYEGYKFTSAHYLSPIGQSIFRQTASNESDISTSVVYQNPGWQRLADTGAEAN